MSSTVVVSREVARLPFTIAPVTSDRHLREVLALRHEAYGRHDYKAGLKRQMLFPDEADLSGTSTTLVAVSKATGEVQGTVRVTSSVDSDIDWPEGTPADKCREGSYTYIDRFAVAAGEDATQVACGLIKAIYLWALGRDSEWVSALALPPLARVYRRRGAMEVRAGGQKVEMPEYHDQEYVLLGVELHKVRPRLAEENPRYSLDFFDKVHPDISVHGMSIPWGQVTAPRLELVHG